jgi:exopolysaccharide biosynthesis polyprenyl glycosylphosphotransferase
VAERAAATVGPVTDSPQPSTGSSRESARLGAPFQGIPWRAQLLSLSFMAADFAGVALAYAAADWAYMSPLFEGLRKRAEFAPAEFIAFGLIMAVVVVLVFGTMGLYRRGVSVLNVEEDVLLLKGFLFHGLLALGLSFALRDFYVPRIAVAGGIVLTGAFVVIGRRAVRALSNRLLSSGVGAQPAVIYGAGDTGRQLAERLISNPQFGLRPLGFIDDRTGADAEVRFGPGRERSLPHLGGGAELAAILADRRARVVLVAMPKVGSERLEDIQERCLEAGAVCYHVPLFSLGHLRRFQLTLVGDMPLVSERAPSFSLFQRAAKRSFDLAVSGLLLVILAPLVFLPVAILLKLLSRGPVFFVQERVGRGGRLFKMCKFRSMHVSAPAYADKPSSGRDPRIFPLGRVLRRTSLDEFPQLWNVLRGEMSLVGPRPEMPHIAETYNPVQRERLLVLPGMTGLWQVSKDRNLPIHEGVDYDLFYIYNQSLLLDLVILARTCIAMFRGR